jgi:uncharacterized protein YbbK (DUF523 family)
MKAKILVSACLVGRPVRYDGSAKTLCHQALERWKAEDRLVMICPELAAGFRTPRPQAEIDGRQSGQDVLSGRARVLEAAGDDVTDLYIAGARAALLLAQTSDCRFALLADGSPSCGSRFIYDGRFAGDKHAGAGVTTALLRENGIEVFAESEIDILQERLASMGR